ncbi:hypothetical protein PIS_054 [Saccharomonospora phage PIS 136]|nr:hypothetical protein PIS_054 [Saccharomonospora phage PIS 136]
MLRIRSARFLCPVDGCDWYTDDVTPATVDTVPLRPDLPVGEATNGAVARVAAACRRETETVLRAHVEGHDVVDWLRTIRRLETELATLRDHLRVDDEER